MMNNTLLQQLTPSQRKAVLHTEGPLLVLAGPGSGKTRVITYRIAALVESGVRANNICAITFTNKAADQMRQRTVALGRAAGAHISTFHSLCARLLRQYAVNAGIDPNFSIYSESEQTRCIKDAIKNCDLDNANFPPGRMLEAVSSLKNRLIDVDAFKSLSEDYFSKTLARIYNRYQVILRENNALDFDDLLMKTAFLLRDNAEIRSAIGERFKFLLIDEYQDTNRAQYEIAKAIVSGHNNICATGDPDQSIYRWRGADIRNIMAFENDWPDAVVVKLEENFRSTPNILEPADKLIAFNRNRKEKKLVPVKPRGADIAISIFEDEQQEAGGIACQVTKLIAQGASPDNMAVFYRVNSASRVLEEAFIQNKIPYQIVRGVEFYNRKEVRDLLGYLKVLVNPDDKIALLRIINNPARGIGKTTIDRVCAHSVLKGISLYESLKKVNEVVSISQSTRAKITAFAAMLERFKKDYAASDGKVGPIADRILAESGLAESLRAGGMEENAEELINAAYLYDQQTQAPSLVDYLQQISLFSDADSYDPQGGRVSFMTLHAAKGLEFENVFIIGLEEGLLPHEKSDTEDEDDLEEERRLLFVGITRAKAGLYISYARYRTIHGQMLRAIPSQFLFELGFSQPRSPAIDQDTCDSDCIDDINTGSAAPPFAAGQTVRHNLFGIGRIKEFIDMGDNSIVVVRFNSGQVKSLMMKYANLTKVAQ